MFNSYFNSTFRSLWKNRLYTFINVIGLAVGLAGFMLIMIYISGELSYDKHHKDSERIYRVAMDLEMSGNITKAAVSGGMLGILMHDELKEVEAYTRMVHYPRSVLFSYEDQKIYFDDILYADSSFFDFFSYKTYAGDPADALREPYSLVLTRSGAERIFGSEDPIGKSILWNGKDTYVVRALIEDPVQASHIHFEALVSFSTLESIEPYRTYINTLYAFVTFNYVRLYEGFDPEDVKAPLDSLVMRHMGERMKESGAGFSFYLQPVRDIYLHSHLRHEFKANGNISNLYIFSAIAIFILLIACINFITLSTARSVKRSLEVGVRKVFGAEKRNLILQFLFESMVMAFISMLFAIALVEFMEPSIEQLSGASISIRMGDIRYYLLMLVGLTALVGLLSGLYPAFVISAYNPLGIIQKRISAGYRSSWFRNSMVVLQFLITIFLVSGTMIIYMQLNFIKNKDTGISLEDRIIVPLRGSAMINKYEDVKTGFLQVKGVEAVTASSTYPGKFRQRAGFYPEGSSRNDMWMLQNVQVDHNYFEVMNVDLVEGYGFSENPDIDTLNVIVNEALVAEAGWENPIGKFVGIPMGEESADIKLNVIGVVSDFNYASLHESVKPLLIMHDPQRLSNITVKISPAGFTSSINDLEREWDRFFPGQPFTFLVLEDDFAQLYKADIRLSEVFIWFTLLAIFIACMGLFGLSSFITSQRTREIGIRKVLGSSAGQIIYMFIRSFALLVLIAAVLAIPLSWYGMHEWLQNFAHQTPMHWWIFPAAAILALLVSTATVFLQSFRASSKNPVDAIRWE